MKVVAFLGSPRAGGNSEIVLNEALLPAKSRGHEVVVFRPSQMTISPCLNCGGCEETGCCVVLDDMTEVYRAIRGGDRFIIASPLFFFGITAQLKALIDRCQAFWSEKYLLKKEIPAGPHGRKGLVLLVGGMDKDIEYTCGDATCKVFLRTISVPQHTMLKFPNIDAKGEILRHPEMLAEIRAAAELLFAT